MVPGPDVLEYRLQSAFFAPPAAPFFLIAANPLGLTTGPWPFPAAALGFRQSVSRSCVLLLHGRAIPPESQLHYRRHLRWRGGGLHLSFECRSCDNGIGHRDRAIHFPSAVATGLRTARSAAEIVRTGGARPGNTPPCAAAW